MSTKDNVISVLLSAMHQEYRYIGGGDGPQIIVMTNSEDWEMQSFAYDLADHLLKVSHHDELRSRLENLVYEFDDNFSEGSSKWAAIKDARETLKKLS